MMSKGSRNARLALTLGLSLGSIGALPQAQAQAPTQAASPVGSWQTINEETNKVQSTVEITESNGVLTGKIVALPDPRDQDAVCDKCTDQRKGARIIGLTIIEGVSNGDGDQYWDGGKILDPNNGKTYGVRLSPQDGGKTLQVRGYLGPFYRTQVWQRTP